MLAIRQCGRLHNKETTDGPDTHPLAFADSIPVAHSDAPAGSEQGKADGMTGTLLLIALAAALYGAWQRDKGSWAANRAVWALTASAAVSCSLRLASVPFSWPLWLSIDIAVIAAIRSGRPSAREQVIVPLTVACWPLYQLQQAGHPLAGHAITLIVAMQFLLTVPWDRLVSTVMTEKVA